MNNALIGITTQVRICKIFNIKIPKEAEGQFKSNYSEDLREPIDKIIDKIFKEVNDRPIECTTYTQWQDKDIKSCPYNFKLKSGKTLSIRTNKNRDKVAPRIVGQPGYETFNKYFGDLVDYKIETKDDIKKIVFDKIDYMLPRFIDYMFIADYTIWINFENENDYKIIERGEAPDLIFDRNDITFTSGTLEGWRESTTIKYKGKSFAEVQVHKNRTFKFRFIMGTICQWLKECKINNETLGMTAEKIICDLFKLERQEHINKRSNKDIEKQILPCIEESFKYLPNAIKHTGSECGERGSTSKCSYDFLLENNKTLSLKTNYGKKVCPPEVGQPGGKTFLKYFGDLLGINEIDSDIFKSCVMDKIHLMLPIYLNHLMDSDYLLWIFKEKDLFYYKIINSEKYRNFNWEKNKISFTKKDIKDWNESNTLKYDNISIGEFQIHRARNCYKFRFNMKNLLMLFEKVNNN